MDAFAKQLLGLRFSVLGAVLQGIVKGPVGEELHFSFEGKDYVMREDGIYGKHDHKFVPESLWRRKKKRTPHG